MQNTEHFDGWVLWEHKSWTVLISPNNKLGKWVSSGVLPQDAVLLVINSQKPQLETGPEVNVFEGGIQNFSPAAHKFRNRSALILHL